MLVSSGSISGDMCDMVKKWKKSNGFVSHSIIIVQRLVGTMWPTRSSVYGRSRLYRLMNVFNALRSSPPTFCRSAIDFPRFFSRAILPQPSVSVRLWSHLDTQPHLIWVLTISTPPSVVAFARGVFFSFFQPPTITSVATIEFPLLHFWRHPSWPYPASLLLISNLLSSSIATFK